MLYRTLTLPIFFRIGKKLLNYLNEILAEENLFFKKVCFLTGNFGEDIVHKKKLNKQFAKSLVINIRKVNKISKIRSFLIEEEFDVIFTIGGGTINDIGKYMSIETSIPLISIPTLLSNDGIASPVSILRLDGKYQSIGTTPPIGVIADIDILKNNKKIYLLSGLGDLFSNISAYLDWELAFKEQNEKIDFVAHNLAYNSAIRVLNFLLQNDKEIFSEFFLQELLNGLILSGIAMIIAKSSRPASGAEHNISHALDRLYGKQLHGLQVGFSTLFTLFLHNSMEILEQLIRIYRKVQFPLNFKDLKIPENIFVKAITLAPHIRKRYTILQKYSFNELLEAFYRFKENFIKNF